MYIAPFFWQLARISNLETTDIIIEFKIMINLSGCSYFSKDR